MLDGPLNQYEIDQEGATPMAKHAQIRPQALLMVFSTTTPAAAKPLAWAFKDGQRHG